LLQIQNRHIEAFRLEMVQRSRTVGCLGVRNFQMPQLLAEDLGVSLSIVYDQGVLPGELCRRLVNR
jgi:hypothetical protein